jgi:hypothetical protein
MMAWALCRETITDLIFANPDLSREEMIEIIREFASHYGFSPAYVIEAELFVDHYILLHKRVKKARKEYPDDLDLMHRLTHVRFDESVKDDFKIQEEPIAFEISCSQSNAQKIYESVKMTTTDEFNILGFASPDNSYIPFFVVIKDCKDFENHYPTTAGHERQHVINRIFLLPLYYSRLGEWTNQTKIPKDLRHQIQTHGQGILNIDAIYELYQQETDPDKKAILLEELMRVIRHKALELRVKDELFAIQSERIPPLTKDDLLSIFLPNNAYDYLQEIRTYRNDPLWQKTAQIILVYEYSQIIDAAIKAFDRLVESGYDRWEAIALLTNITLLDWPKTVKRFLEQTEGK